MARKRVEGSWRVVCACGAVLHTFLLPYGEEHGELRKRCPGCDRLWNRPIAELLDGADTGEHSVVVLGPSGPSVEPPVQ